MFFLVLSKQTCQAVYMCASSLVTGISITPWALSKLWPKFHQSCIDAGPPHASHIKYSSQNRAGPSEPLVVRRVAVKRERRNVCLLVDILTIKPKKTRKTKK